MKRLISAIFDEKSPFDYIFDERINSDDPAVLDQPDVRALILWGGEDISPSLYGHGLCAMTDATTEPSRRDRIELTMAKRAVELGIPMIGICRGAQFLCALSGGTLIQHVTGHAGRSHEIITNKGESYITNSVHHQMMNPFEVDHELLAWCPTNLSKLYLGANDTHVAKAYRDDFKEPEIVWFPKTKALCIQGHPEYSNAPLKYIRHCLDLVNERILLNVPDAG